MRLEFALVLKMRQKLELFFKVILRNGRTGTKGEEIVVSHLFNTGPTVHQKSFSLRIFNLSKGPITSLLGVGKTKITLELYLVFGYYLTMKQKKN
jgi:hypothetical protein